MTSIQEQIRQTVLAHPGKDAAAIMDLAKGVTDQKQCAAMLKFLIDDGKVSRAKIDGRFCYWPPGKAPEGDVLPGVDIDRAHKARIEPTVVATVPAAAFNEVMQRKAPQPPASRPTKIVTPDWTIYPIEDELLIMHKDTATGFRLDAETVAVIRGIEL